ncbi:hypothetical protein Tco_0521332, partial [Tanacetum coccineum]
CVDIPLITPIRSVIFIPFERNQSEASAAPAAEGPSTQDSRGKGIMTDAVEASSRAPGLPRPSSGSDISFRDLSGDAIHRDFFPFS